MSENVLEYVKNYIHMLPEPKNYWRKSAFEQECMVGWSARELYRYMLTHGGNSVSAIQEFADLMDEYSMSNVRTSLIFSIARDTALDIMQHFLGK